MIAMTDVIEMVDPVLSILVIACIVRVYARELGQFSGTVSSQMMSRSKARWMLGGRRRSLDPQRAAIAALTSSIVDENTRLSLTALILERRCSQFEFIS